MTEFLSCRFLQKIFCQTFKNIHHIFLLHESHFAVYLCKFRLSVRTEVFITETFYNLKIFVHSAHHQKLFESLRRLRKCIELPFVHTARHHEIPRSLWSRFDKNRRFHLYKALLREIVSYFLCDFMSENKFVLHWISSNVQISVFHAKLLTAVGFIFDGKRRQHRFIQNCEFFYQNLYFSCWDFWVFRSSFYDFSFHLDDKFTPQVFSLFQKVFGSSFFIKNQLSDAISVTQIHPNHKSFVSDSLHPARKRNGFVKIFQRQFAISMCSKHIFI